MDRCPPATPRACSTAATSCSAASAPAAWRRCTSPRTRPCTARSRSRCSRSATPRTSSSSSASAARRSPRRGSTTRTSSRSTTAASPTARYYIVMEYLEGPTLKDVIRRARRPRAEPRDRLRARRSSPPSVRPPPRRRAPRHQAAQRRGVARRATQGHRLRHRPRRRLADDRGRLDRRHGPVPLAGAGARARWSARRPTSTPSGSCCTRCSPAGCRSRATPPSRSR